jgi:hypothetical protein
MILAAEAWQLRGERMETTVTRQLRPARRGIMLIPRILRPIDFSEFSTRAFRRALSRVVAQHVGEMWKYLHKGGQEHLQEFVNQHRHEGIHPELAICEGRAPDAILSFAQRETVDLVVMGTHGRRGFGRLMLGFGHPPGDARSLLPDFCSRGIWCRAHGDTRSRGGRK